MTQHPRKVIFIFAAVRTWNLTNFLEINFNMLSSSDRFSNFDIGYQSVSFIRGFRLKILYASLFLHSGHMSCPVLLLFDYHNDTMRIVQITKFLNNTNKLIDIHSIVAVSRRAKECNAIKLICLRHSADAIKWQLHTHYRPVSACLSSFRIGLYACRFGPAAVKAGLIRLVS